MCLYIRYFKIIIVFHPHLLHIFSGGEINNWGFIPNASGWKYANWCPSSRPRVRGCWKLHMFAPLLMNYSVSTRCLIGQRPISKRWCIICIRIHLWNYHGNGSRLSHCASKVPRWLQHLQLTFTLGLQHLHFFPFLYRKLTVAIFRADIGFIKNCV